jgi:hypothetical protein
MENQEVYNIGKGVKEVTITHKKALDELMPEKVGITGNIDSVFNWLEKRVKQLGEPTYIDDPENFVAQKTSHVLIDRDKMEMALTFNETDPLYIGFVQGKLSKHPDFTQWQINNGNQWSNEDLSEFIKMNRNCFKSKADAMKLSAELKNLKIKVDKEMEASNDNRGNVRVLAGQKVVDSTIPKSFHLNVPVFKGQGKSEFEVEVYVNAQTFNVSLVSPDANDIVSEVRDSIIDEQKKKIQEIAPELVIIEQ